MRVGPILCLLLTYKKISVKDPFGPRVRVNRSLSIRLQLQARRSHSQLRPAGLDSTAGGSPPSHFRRLSLLWTAFRRVSSFAAPVCRPEPGGRFHPPFLVLSLLIVYLSCKLCQQASTSCASVRLRSQAGIKLQDARLKPGRPAL